MTVNVMGILQCNTYFTLEERFPSCYTDFEPQAVNV